MVAIAMSRDVLRRTFQNTRLTFLTNASKGRKNEQHLVQQLGVQAEDQRCWKSAVQSSTRHQGGFQLIMAR